MGFAPAFFPSARVRARRLRRGVTLTEASLWAAILVFVIVGLIGVYTAINNNLRESQTLQLTQHLLNSVRALYSNTINYAGLTPALLINASDVQPQYQGSTAGTIISPEDEPILLTGWDSGFAIYVETGRTGTCLALLSTFLDNPEVGHSVTSADLTALAAPTTFTPTATASIAAANTACVANTNVILGFGTP
ncbi:MAG: hypothetical protein OXI87_12380 [Albidovulum sp.]|nr:hypothetical protein [Albidovulum sp.]